MNSGQVAAELNLSLSEFQKIEESIASILGLARDSEGNFEYSSEDLGSLKEVFLDPHVAPKKQEKSSEPEAVKGSEQWKQNMSETLDSGAPSKISLSSAETDSQWWASDLDSIDNKVAADNHDQEEVVAPPVHQARVHTPKDTRLRIPGFERLRRDESGEIRMADYEQAWNPQLKKSTSVSNNLNQQFRPPYPIAPEHHSASFTDPTMIGNERNFNTEANDSIEKRLRDLEKQDVQHLREENLFIKKENLALRKEIQTLENIIRNQDNDRMYLVQRLNEKFTLKRLLQWRLHGEESFSGHSSVSK